VQYCNGSLYNTDDPQDKTRPCNLQNLKTKAQTYHDMVLNTTQAYITWATQPARISINDDDYINRTPQMDAWYVQCIFPGVAASMAECQCPRFAAAQRIVWCALLHPCSGGTQWHASM
jgi:hypothetical protein